MSSSVSQRRGVLAVVLALAAVVLLPTASAPAKKKSCARSGDVLIAVSPHVRVVRRRLARLEGATRVELAACWKATGRRSRLDVEEENAPDLVIGSAVEIVGDRHIGVVTSEYGGPGEARSAAIYDAKTGRRLHTTHAGCLGALPGGPFEGITDVVFLTGGGMAFTCDRLLLFRRASSQTAELIEPPGTHVRDLAASFQHLYWHVETEDGEITATKSLALF